MTVHSLLRKSSHHFRKPVRLSIITIKVFNRNIKLGKVLKFHGSLAKNTHIHHRVARYPEERRAFRNLLRGVCGRGFEVYQGPLQGRSVSRDELGAGPKVVEARGELSGYPARVLPLALAAASRRRARRHLVFIIVRFLCATVILRTGRNLDSLLFIFLRCLYRPITNSMKVCNLLLYLLKYLIEILKYSIQNNQTTKNDILLENRKK